MTVTEDDATPDPVEPDTDDDGEAPRRKRTALFVSLAVAVVLVAFVAVLATRDPATDRVADSPLIDKPAPPLAGATLGGGSFDIDDHVGRWVVVNYFATWCVPCRQEHPQLLSFDETHTQLDDAVLVSVVFDDDPDTVQDYFDDNGGEWPVVADSGDGISASWGVGGVPETYLVAPSGKVVAKIIGGVTQRGLEDLMAQEAAKIRASADDAGSGS